MQRIVVIGAVLGALVVAGCGKTKINRVPQVQSPCDFDAGQHLNSVGLCVDCTSNADCPDGLQCNLLTGKCENIPPPPPDAGQVVTCQVGAVRCSPDGRAVQTCVAEDAGTSDWQNTTPCTAQETCNPQTLTCAICIPGETTCDSSDQTSTYQRCKDDGTGFQGEDCSTAGTGFICHQVVNHTDPGDGGPPISALATCRLCNPGSSQAVTAPDGGNGILSCDSTGTTETYNSCYPTNQFGTYADGGMASPPFCQVPVCFPGDHKCTAPANTSVGRQSCNSDGTGYVQDDCTGGEVCGPTPTDRGACLSPCDVAENSSSYQGCDFWGSLLSNSGLDPAFTGGVSNQGVGTQNSQFAFVVGNTSSTLTATVSVTTHGTQVAPITVAPLSTGIVYLPWQEICGTGTGNFAYHLTSDVPVTVYQFNPLASAIGGTYSYSNDASLLLPTHLLGTSYVVVAQDQITLGTSNSQSRNKPNGASNYTGPLPGAMSVVATKDNTHVTIRFAGAVLATSDVQNGSLIWAANCGSTQGNLAAVARNASAVYTMNTGDVIQFWNDIPSSDTPNCAASDFAASNGLNDACLWPEDFTGSVVSSDQPVAVFGGADCTTKPFTGAACDHVEEEMFPFSTWGKNYVGVKSQQYAGSTQSYPDYWRVVSGCGPNSCPNGTTITITPPISGNARQGAACSGNCSCTSNATATTCVLPPLQSGSTAPWIEFKHNSSFVANADNPAVLAQYFNSQSEGGTDAFGSPTATVGDPSLVLAPPIEQWRSDYSVLAPTTYANNFVNLMVAGAASTNQVQVDGTTVTGWNQIAGTNYYGTVYQLSNSGSGSHQILGQSGVKVGVVVYGYDSYVSYGYTGGLDLQAITNINPGQ